MDTCNLTYLHWLKSVKLLVKTMSVVNGLYLYSLRTTQTRQNKPEDKEK